MIPTCLYSPFVIVLSFLFFVFSLDHLLSTLLSSFLLPKVEGMLLASARRSLVSPVGRAAALRLPNRTPVSVSTIFNDRQDLTDTVIGHGASAAKAVDGSGR